MRPDPEGVPPQSGEATELPEGPLPVAPPESTATVPLGAEAIAEAWHLVVPPPSPEPVGQWVGKDGAIPNPAPPAPPTEFLTDELGWGSYGRGSPRRVIVGRLGECAVETWFTANRHEVEPLFRDRYRKGAADLLVDKAMPLDTHPRYAPPWVDHVKRRDLQERRGDPVAELGSRIEPLRWHVARHGTPGPVVEQVIVPRPTLVQGVDAWPPLSRWKVDAEGDVHRVLNVKIDPPWAPFFDLAVEVKTWSAHSWETYGHQLNADQVRSILGKAEVVIWCRLLDGLPEVTPVALPPARVRVELAGWSSVEDLTNYGEPFWASPVRARLHIPADRIRPIGDLTPTTQAELPPWPRPPSLPQLPIFGNTRGDCGHYDTLAGLCWQCPHPANAGGNMVDRRKIPGRDGGNWGEVPRVTISKGVARYFHHADPEEVTRVHHEWPFTADTMTTPVTSICLDLPPCHSCFPGHR